MHEYMTSVKQLPPYLKPKYVGQVVERFFDKTAEEVLSRRFKGEHFIADSLDPFVQKLALAVFQHYGRIPINDGFWKDHKDSMCAGIKDKCTGAVRCWGRDTFIALRGLLIGPSLGRQQ